MASRNNNRRAVNKRGYKGSYASILSYGYRVRAFLMLNVATYPTLPITAAQQLTDLQTLVAALSFYTGKTTNRCSAAQLADIKNALQTVKSNLNVLTAYVNTIALQVNFPVAPGSMAAIIGQSGMPTDKQRAPIGRLAPVSKFRQFIHPSVPQGNVKVSWARPAGSKLKKGYTYQVELSTVLPAVTPTIIGIVTQTKIEFTGSTYGAGPYYIRVTPVSPLKNASRTGNTKAIGAPSPWLKAMPQF
jgi:hypothetical protein